MALKKLNIIYDDDHLVVIDKPAGLLVIPDRKGALSVKEYLNNLFPGIYTVHRIDRDTSGLVIFAKHAEAHRSLSLQFESHSVIKKYQAFVRGRLPEKSLVIDKPIGKHPRKANVMIIDSRGKAAHSVCTVIEIFKHASFAEIEISTGRTHQIRVHLQFAEYPLLVDSVYGNKEAFYLSEIKHNYKAKEIETPIIQRLTLHANFLQVKHPDSGKEISFVCELPADLQLLLKMLKKYDAVN